MKKNLYPLILLATLGFALNASADFYAGLGIGGSFNDGSAIKNNIKTEYKNSTFYSLYGGYELPLPLFDIRGELEYQRIRPELKDGRTKQLDGLFANAYGTIPLIPLIDPYVGLGLGRVRYDHSNSFAFQYMLGADYELPFAPVTIGGEYRYLKVNETTGKANVSSKYHTNILMLKARYLF
jgi:opacity protein-like surface antigen